MSGLMRLMAAIAATLVPGPASDQPRANNHQLSELHNGAATQPTANNDAALDVAEAGSLVTAQSGNCERVDHPGNNCASPSLLGKVSGMLARLGRKMGIQAGSSTETMARTGDHVVGAGAVDSTGSLVSGQASATGTQATGTEIEFGGVVKHNKPRESTTDLSLHGDAARSGLSHRPTTSSTAPLVDNAAYHAGTDVEAQVEPTSDALPGPATLVARVIASAREITLREAVKTTVAFAALAATLYGGIMQGKSYYRGL